VAALLGYAPLWFAPGPAMVAIPWYLLLFAFGMVAAAVGFSAAALPRSLRSQVPWGMTCAALWGGCIVFSMTLANFWFAHKPLADLLVGLATFALLVYLTERARGASRGRLLPLLESRALVGLGHFSYSLYLTHLPVLAGCFFALRRLGWSGGVQAVAVLVVGSTASLIVAYAFHVAIERRFIARR
jgi:peptidoglycan/LPS O-acetylase OafA/YrhL